MNKKTEKKSADDITKTLDTATEKALSALLKIKRLQVQQAKTGIDLENKKHIEVLAQQFTVENQDLFEMVGRRLIDYAQSGNSLYINWMSQSLIGLLKQANEGCKKRLGIIPEVVQ